VRVQRLLAARELGLIRRVAHAHEDRVFLGQHLGDVHRERQVAARVRGQLHAVAPHGRDLIDRAEVQQHPTPFSRRGSKGAVVVQPLAGLQGAAHAGGLCFRRVGHQNAAVPRSGVFSCLGNGVLPQAVQVLIAVPAHGRARIFREWVHGFTAFDLLVSF